MHWRRKDDGLPKSTCADQPLYKSLIDYPLALLLVLTCALPMLCIALAIKLDSSGPIFFSATTRGLRRQDLPDLEVPHDVSR